MISEEMRKTFSEQLRESMVRDEASKNENFNQSMQQQIQGHNIQFLQEQFGILFDSVHNISADKKLGDRLYKRISELENANKDMGNTLKEQQESIGRLIAERDSYKDDTEELLATKKKLEFDTRMQHMSMKQRNERLDTELKKKLEECEKLNEDLQK